MGQAGAIMYLVERGKEVRQPRAAVACYGNRHDSILPRSRRPSLLTGRLCALRLLVPLNCGGESLRHGGARMEPEIALGAGDIEAAPRLAIRLAGIPYDAAIITAQAGDGLRQIADRDFFLGPQVNGIRAVVPDRKRGGGGTQR